MWKAIAWIMLLYGLLATAVAVGAGDRQRSMQQRFAAWAAEFKEIKQQLASTGSMAPPVADFEHGQMLAACTPGAELQLAGEGTASWLQWTPDRSGAGIDILGILLSPGPQQANALSMRMRANFDGRLAIGVHEADGSDYMLFPERVTPLWEQYEFELASMQLGEDSSDENGKLDLDQVEAVIVAYMDTPAGQLPEPEQRRIFIDDVLFMDIGDNPMFEDFGRDPQGPGGRRPPHRRPGAGAGAAGPEPGDR